MRSLQPPEPKAQSPEPDEMPKLKTHRGAAKRFKKTGTGKIRRASAFKRHILTSKTTKSKRKMRKQREVAPAGRAEAATHAAVQIVGRW